MAIVGKGELFLVTAGTAGSNCFSVTVILPKSLAEDDKVLRLTRLGQLALP